MERFAKKIIERSILDVWQSSEYGFVKYLKVLGISYYFCKTLHFRCLTGLLLRFFEMYKDLVSIILRERKNLPVALWNI